MVGYHPNELNMGVLTFPSLLLEYLGHHSIHSFSIDNGKLHTLSSNLKKDPELKYSIIAQLIHTPILSGTMNKINEQTIGNHLYESRVIITSQHGLVSEKLHATCHL
ncbi:hypothetical protein Smp_174080 [Schistosoma mansoni]|uniref:hypothetical protein n=1 Tax=Schistosoma mansoni TaxID=6183 RepID=UPI0001A61CEF|nr:hypothetical protein Smp_174080 [Schistosoma mansoni]|eukprot:XP_018654688.1 hypothetical protein Smp_174080 [Schistosoma mansoni]